MYDSDRDQPGGAAARPAPPDAHAPDGMLGRLIATIVFSSLANGAMASGRLAVPMIALGLGASTVLVGFISSMFTLVPMVSNIRFGRWVDL